MEIIIKKRGRKPKIVSDENIIVDNVIKKRGRKPNNIINNEINNELTNKLKISLSQNLDIEDDINTNINNIIINNYNWIEKYKITNLDDLIDNKDQINKLRNWLNNFETSKFHTTVISGGHGVGKNLISTLLLLEKGYKIKYIYGTNLKSKFILNELIYCNLKTKNAYTFLNNKITQKYAIIIDDTENISLTSEKDNLIELFKLNEKNRYFPLILISNLQHSKLINNFKKISLSITINSPSVESLLLYINNICLKENIKFNDDKIKLHLIRFCQYDIRKLISILQDLYYTYKEKIITSDMFKEYLQMTQKKNIDIGLYNATKYLLDNYKNINDCLQLYETEKVLLPLTIYENYHQKLFLNKLNNNDILKLMSDITDSISIGDVIETNIYSDQNWFLQNIHGFYTCVYTSYLINLKIPNNKSKYEVVFSADLNKTSSKNINKKKNIVTLQSKFKNKNIDDIIYINKIIYELSNNSNNNELIKKLKKIYNLDNKNIQIALKIDKTN
jgi:hypothetical protein